jgi:hypothetical protein
MVRVVRPSVANQHPLHGIPKVHGDRVEGHVALHVVEELPHRPQRIARCTASGFIASGCSIRPGTRLVPGWLRFARPVRCRNAEARPPSSYRCAGGLDARGSRLHPVVAR